MPELVTRRVWGMAQKLTGSAPVEIGILKPPERKSAVYRLLMKSGNSLVLKRCDSTTGSVEARIYQDVLCPLRVSAPTLHAYLEADGVAWLLLDDVAGTPYSPSIGSQYGLAGRWMAELHLSSAPLVNSVPLPSRGFDYYRQVLDGARETLDAAGKNPLAWSGPTASILDGLQASLDLLDTRWEDAQSMFQSAPSSLVHGGFAGKNVHVKSTPLGSILFAFDWEAGGWGPPFADLSRVSLTSYSDVLAQESNRSFGDLERWASLGTILWHLAPIPGERSSVGVPWISRVAGKFAYYDEQIRIHLDRLWK